MAVNSEFARFESDDSVVCRGGVCPPSFTVVILLSQRAGKPRPYEACHLGSYFSKNETPENESPGACFCLFLLFTEVEQKNFISLL